MAIGKSINFPGTPFLKSVDPAAVLCGCIAFIHNTVFHHGSEVMALLPKSVEKIPVLPVLYSLSGMHKPIFMISVVGQSLSLKVLPSQVLIRKDLVVLYLPH